MGWKAVIRVCRERVAKRATRPRIDNTELECYRVTLNAKLEHHPP